MSGKLIAVIALVVVVLVGWATLFVTSRGVLVSGEEPEAGAALPILKCKYFTGNAVAERTYVYTPDGVMGKSKCPMLVEIE